MIVSVHIPKTAGVSFGKFLHKVYKDKFMWMCPCNVCKRIIAAKDHSDFIRTMNLCELHITMEELNEQLQDKECVHGHFSVKQFQHLGDIIFWLRDPVQRIISAYYHHERDPKQFQFDLPVKNPLLYFSNTGNEMSLLAEGKKPAFVGFTDSFDLSIELFREKFSISEKYDFGFENNNPLKTPGTKYSLDKKLIALAKQFNQGDIAYYKKMKKENEFQLSC